jgi:tRNA 5-methylaminomethyl-2-thiouridine biosynthesis bifunctional protein
VNAASVPGVWQGLRRWHALDLGSGQVLNFLTTWQAWRQDEQRPERLFFTLLSPQALAASDVAQLAVLHPSLHELATQLGQAWRGMLPGMHRLVFDAGRVQLTLGFGPAEKLLREIDTAVDHITLAHWPADDDTALHTLKALSRLCRLGTRLTAEPGPSSAHLALQQCGFDMQNPSLASSGMQAVFAPNWTPRSRPRSAQHPDSLPRQALVLGAGLSGSATAFSLAQRGWQVRVLDAGAAPGAGASGLPAGLTAPHVSPDDNVLSRITRAGVRATVQRAAQLLQAGQDWAPTGVLEHRVEGKRSLPIGEAWPAPGHEWSTPASSEHMAQAGLPAQAQALWHSMGAWIRPRALAHAQLQTHGIDVHWDRHVTRLVREGQDWVALDAQGEELGRAPVLVIAGGFDTRALLQHVSPDQAPLPLNPLRGQISMGPLSALPEAAVRQLPPFPVNGHGSFITGVPMPDANPQALGMGEAGWYLGSTFERACPEALLRDEDHAANHARLATLLPGLSEPMRQAFALDQVRGWAGLRCTLPDRVPAVGALDAERWPGLYVCAGMGARGISLSVLAGELIAAQLEGEPLPLAPTLAQYLAASRFAGSSQPG